MTKGGKWPNMFGNRISSFNDNDSNDTECARIEFEDEEPVPVLHCVHRDDVKDEKPNRSLDLSRLDDEHRQKNHKKIKTRKSSEKDKESRKDSEEKNNKNIVNTVTPSHFNGHVPNGNIPTVSEHVPIVPESKLCTQHYPEEYCDNMFLEAKLTYAPPTNEVSGELLVEKRDEAVQTPEVLGEESESEDKNEGNADNDVLAVEHNVRSLMIKR